MKVRTHVLLVLAMITALLATSSPGAGAQTFEDKRPDLWEERDVEGLGKIKIHDLDTRRVLGFERTDEAILRSASESRKNGSVDEFFMALSDAELQKVRALSEAIDDAGQAHIRLKEDPSYGGVYYDSISQRVVVLRSDLGVRAKVSNEDLLRRGNIRAISKENFRVETVRSSWAELDSATQDLGDEILRDGLIGIATDPKSNGLVLDYEDTLTIAEARKAAALVVAELGIEVDYRVQLASLPEDTTCLNRNRCAGNSARRAGVGIHVNDQPCTSGFIVEDASGDRFALTAGHCWYSEDSGVVRSRSGQLWFGSLIQNHMSHGYIGGANAQYITCDCRLIQISDDKAFPALYQIDSNKLRTITHDASVSVVGWPIKMFGSSTGFTTGEVVAVNKIRSADATTPCFPICTYRNQTVANINPVGGDSGGAITRFSPNRALGVVSGKTKFNPSTGLPDPSGSWHLFYSDTYHVELDLDVDVVLG